MGGRGTFASGNSVSYRYKTVGKIHGVKVLQPINATRSFKLPQEAHSSSAYIAIYSDGTFKQYIEFNSDKTVKFDIDYHPPPRTQNKREP